MKYLYCERVDENQNVIVELFNILGKKRNTKTVYHVKIVPVLVYENQKRRWTSNSNGNPLQDYNNQINRGVDYIFKVRVDSNQNNWCETTIKIKYEVDRIIGPNKQIFKAVDQDFVNSLDQRVLTKYDPTFNLD